MERIDINFTPERYKYFFTDIDGTLLNKERAVTPAVKEEINRISRKLNVPVTLVSSRMPKAMRHLQKELGISDPIISYNGALIMNGGDHEILFSRLIPFDTVKTIYSVSKNLKLHTSIYLFDDWFVEELDFWADREITSTKVTPRALDFAGLFNREIKEKQGAHKVMCMGDETAVDKLFKELKEKQNGGLNLYRSKPVFLEITPGEITKASAVEFLLKRYGGTKHEAVAAGDNYNDTEMLLYAGAGAAMGNAPAEVKAIADYVSLPNTMDGLAEVIKKYFP